MPAETPAQPPRQQLADELEATCAEGTPAPWWVEKCPHHAGRLLIKYRWDDVPTWIAESSERKQAAADFSLMVLLRNNFPAIVDALRAADAAPVDLGAVRKDAATVTRLLELGDHRLHADEGPAGGQLPKLSPEEWGQVYRACKRIAVGGGGGRGEGR